MKVPGIEVDRAEKGEEGPSDGRRLLKNVEVATLAGMLEGIQDAAFLLDPQGRFIAVNAEAVRRFGIPPTELLCQSCFEVSFNNPPLRRDKLDEILQTKKPVRYEERFGDLFVENNGAPILDDMGEVRFVAVFAQDVTNFKREDMALRASERKYRLLASNFPDGMVLLVDKELRIMLIDGQVTERLMLPKELLVGRRLSDLLGEPAQATVRSLYEMSLIGERSEADVPFSGGTLHVHVIPIKEEEEVESALIVATDVTLQRAQEVALRTSEERLKSVFDHALVGIYRTTPDGRIIMANPALVDLLGFSSFEELAERNLNQEGFDVKTPRRVFLERIDREGCVQDMYSTWTRADGRLIHIRDSATAIKDEKGRTLYYEGTIEDVTEKEAYKAQIEQLNQSLRVVNSILRHDIMNDLTVAIGSLDLYRRKSDPKQLDATDRSMRKCSNLIRKMKELESIISTNELKVMSARDVIREVLGHYTSHGVEFLVEGDGLILADEAVVPALDNIVSNALTHTHTERVIIKVATDPERQWCELSIADLGGGIPDEIKGLIFQEGFRYGDTGNTGLGLYIVRKTMERYGGEAKVMDNLPQGAVFVLRFRTPGLGRGEV